MLNRTPMLLILDAARPDFLFNVDSFPDASETTTAISPASWSREFIESEFEGKNLHDTVYVTANPYATELSGDVFHTVINLLDTEWNPETMTVSPASVLASAQEVHEQFSDKQLIVHFMQPHFPFLGPKGADIESGINEGGHPWYDQLSGIGVGPEKLRDAFAENHEIVVPYARRLVDKLDGKTVITADHANLVGERGRPIPIRQWGHPVEYYHPDLITVPWIVFDGERRPTCSESPVSNMDMSEDTVNNRLKALGYTD